jgi:hypothetical protein
MNVDEEGSPRGRRRLGVQAMTRSCLLTLFVVVLLPAAASARGAPDAAAGAAYRMALAQVADEGVLDEARLFSAETVKAARDRIQHIRRLYGCPVLIDTVYSAPVAANDLPQWAKERSQELGVEGIHVLICKQPLRVAAVTWPDRFEEKLRPEERKRIEGLFTRALSRSPVERLLPQSLARSPDRALLLALDEIRDDLKKHAGPEAPAVPLAPLGAIFAATIGVWLVLSVVRRRWHKPEPFSLAAEPQPVGLTAGLLAGMFGTPCTYWITDRLFPYERTGGVAGTVREESAPPAEPGVPPADHLEEPLPEHAETKGD